MAEKYLGLAHLLYEHGYQAEGYDWMEFAKEYAADAGLDPNKEWEAYFEGFVRSWRNAEKDKELQKKIKAGDTFLARYMDERDKIPLK